MTNRERYSIKVVANTSLNEQENSVTACKLSCISINEFKMPVYKFSNNNNSLLCGDFYNLRLWRIISESQNEDNVGLMEALQLEINVTALEWFPDDDGFAIGDDAGVIRLYAINGQEHFQFEAQTAAVNMLRVHKNGRYILASFSDHKIVVIDLSNGYIFRPAFVHKNPICSLGWSYGDDFFSASANVVVWQTFRSYDYNVMKDHIHKITRAVYDPHSNILVSCDRKGNLLTTVNGSKKFDLRLIGNNVKLANLEWSPQGRIIISNTIEGNIRLWDGQSGELLRNFAPRSPIVSVAISPDGQFIAGGCYGRKVQILSTKTGEITTVYSEQMVSFDKIVNVEWSQNGEWLAAKSGCGDVMVFRFTKTYG